MAIAPSSDEVSCCLAVSYMSMCTHTCTCTYTHHITFSPKYFILIIKYGNNEIFNLEKYNEF